VVRTAADPQRRRTASLARAIADALGRVLPPASPCALLDFPYYANVGDSAIWLGARAYLARVGARVVYAADDKTYSKQTLGRRLQGGTILISGGGNLGDLYPRRQRFRERVIRDFPRHTIIQLPQSIHFRRREDLRHAQEVFNDHQNLILCVRDRHSLALARKHFSARIVLCPDMAFALGTLKRPAIRARTILCLLRTDTESRVGTLPRAGRDVVRADWMKGEELVLGSPPEVRPSLRSYDRLAQRRLRRGITMLSHAGVVITDRLHGHILSILLGIPSILLDNTYGKNRSFYKTWTSSHPFCAWAESPRGALKYARRWVEQMAPSARPGPTRVP